MKQRNIQWYGFRRDAKDDRDHLFDHVAVIRLRNGQLPAAVDLSANCPPVMDQGELGSCTAHGITGALRYTMIKMGHGDYPAARLQLYYDERVVEGTVKSDAGAEIRDGIKCVATTGVAHETLWPYTIKRFAAKPPAKVYADAKKFEALSYKRVTVSVDALKAALASGYPVIIGVSLYNQFESDQAAKDGVVAMPTGGTIGGHCLYVIGYGQKPGYFTVRNSWADDWGDKGNCYFPEAYLGSTKYGSDYWIIDKVS